MIFSEQNKLSKEIKNKKICVFGPGILFQECYSQFVLIFGRKPDYFCDNDSSKWNTELFDIKFISIEELIKIEENTIIVIASKKYQDIYHQLTTLGISNIYLINYNRGYNNISDINALTPSLVDYNNDRAEIIDLKGKWAFITGASRGIGFLIARELAKLGVNLIIQSRKKIHTDKLVEKYCSKDIQIIQLEAEFCVEKDITKMFSHIDKIAPKIDIVFNNAAVSIPNQKDLWEVNENDYLQTYLVNTIVPIKICNYFIPKMLEHGFGKIVNISSSIKERFYEMSYACSKAAFDKYTFDMASKLEGTNVEISLADPGWVQTDMGGKDAPNSIDSIVPGILLGAVIDGSNGKWISVQDYSNLSLQKAVQKAKFLLNNSKIERN